MGLCACNHRFLTVTEDGQLLASSEKAQEREVMTVCLLSWLLDLFTSLLLTCQMWSDVPAVKKKRTTGEEETDLARKDMVSVEYSYV